MRSFWIIHSCHFPVYQVCIAAQAGPGSFSCRYSIGPGPQNPEQAKDPCVSGGVCELQDYSDRANSMNMVPAAGTHLTNIISPLLRQPQGTDRQTDFSWTLFETKAQKFTYEKCMSLPTFWLFWSWIYFYCRYLLFFYIWVDSKALCPNLPATWNIAFNEKNTQKVPKCQLCQEHWKEESAIFGSCWLNQELGASRGQARPEKELGCVRDLGSCCT